MKTFVVVYINFFDNDLILEIIQAEDEQQARWKHSKLQGSDWDGCQVETKDMDNDEFGQWCFNMDFMVSVIEIPSNNG